MKYDKRELGIGLASIAAKSLIYEVSCFPSPGLVSPISNGSHFDMNFYTFVNSISSLIKPFILYGETGFSNEREAEIFLKLREIGKIAEIDMLKETNGVNTHKGAIFLFGISIGAVAKSLYENLSFCEIKNVIKKFTFNLFEIDFKKENKNDLSHGEEVYFKYGHKGIRAEVEKGIPIVFDFALTLYDSLESLSFNDRLVHTLIGIMQHCDDTNILYRKSDKWLSKVKEDSKEVIRLGGMYTQEGKSKIHTLEKIFKENNISPGGSADLLSITVFFSEIRKRYFQNNF